MHTGKNNGNGMFSTLFIGILARHSDIVEKATNRE